MLYFALLAAFMSIGRLALIVENIMVPFMYREGSACMHMECSVYIGMQCLLHYTYCGLLYRKCGLVDHNMVESVVSVTD